MFPLTQCLGPGEMSFATSAATVDPDRGARSLTKSSHVASPPAWWFDMAMLVALRTVIYVGFALERFASKAC